MVSSNFNPQDDQLRVVELFAGVGGFRLGLEGWQGNLQAADILSRSKMGRVDIAWCGPINGSRARSVSMPAKFMKLAGEQHIIPERTFLRFQRRPSLTMTYWSEASLVRITVWRPLCATARGFVAERASSGGRLSEFSERKGTKPALLVPRKRRPFAAESGRTARAGFRDHVGLLVRPRICRRVEGD